MKNINREYREVLVHYLHPHEGNANKGDLDIIAESVETNGFFGACVVRDHPTIDGEYQILVGEHRWRTAVREGAAVVPCIIVDVEDDVHAARVMLVDNESAKRSTYDAGRLTALLEGVGDLTGTGFDLGALEDFEEERRANEPLAEPEEEEFVREFGVVVIVEGEAEQRELYNEFRERGLTVRVASI